MDLRAVKGKPYIVIVKDCCTRYSWVYVLERKCDATNVYRKFSGDVCGDCLPSELDKVGSDKGR